MHANIHTTTRFSINPKISYTYIDDEAVLMGIEDETLYGLNAVATEILKQLESSVLSLQDITHFLMTQYHLDDVKSTEDATLFLQDMLNKQLILATEDEIHPQ